MTGFHVELRRPPDLPAAPGPPSASDHASVVMDACELLAATNTEFRMSGFGNNHWPVDVSYDLSTFMEALPAALAALTAGEAAEIDMYGQGIERTLAFARNGDEVTISCQSRTSWRPSPGTETMPYADLLTMLQQVAREFDAALAALWPVCEDLRRLLRDDSLDHGAMLATVRSLSGVEGCVAAGLAGAAAGDDWLDFGRYLWAAYAHPSRDYTPVLVDVLRRRDEKAPNEAVVDLLIDVKDAAAFDVLSDMLWWHPEFDDADAIAVKAVYALADLPGGEEAVRGAAETGPEQVRLVARTVLEHLVRERRAAGHHDG